MASAGSKLAPLLDRVLVERLPAYAETLGGVILPTTLQTMSSGKVIAAGERRFEDGRRMPLNVKAGDTVLLPELGGEEFKHGEKEYVFYREEEILGILVD